MQRIQLYDATLRDGGQGKRINFTGNDKIKITQLLDDFGMDYIEGGWPGSNPIDCEFFSKMQGIKLKNAKLSAFGSTRHAKLKPEDDKNLQALVAAQVPVACIFGKSWDLHVTQALCIPLEENLEMIFDSVQFLKKNGMEVIYDAEHFFDGYKRNPEYTIKTLKAAAAGGADNITLCDTNGGSLPSEIATIIEEVKKHIKLPLGIHTHNDSEMGVANSIVAVQQGVILVQGTINGFGERCGNANLCSIIPALQLKLGITCLSKEKLAGLKSLSQSVYAISNIIPNEQAPYVGNNAFAHKGGIHVSAVLKNPETYEHINPELVGNKREVTVSELSGISNLVYKAKTFGFDTNKDDPKLKELMGHIKQLENDGYSFEEGDASFQLLLMRTFREKHIFFTVDFFRVTSDMLPKSNNINSDATIKLSLDGKIFQTSAQGSGPIEALEAALRKALEDSYPILKTVNLVDYKVRMLEGQTGASAKARVAIKYSDGKHIWDTVGVSNNIIEASWFAILDGIEYKLAVNNL